MLSALIGTKRFPVAVSRSYFAATCGTQSANSSSCLDLECSLARAERLIARSPALHNEQPTVDPCLSHAARASSSAP